MNRHNQQQSLSEPQQGEQISQHSQSSQFIKVKAAGRTNLCEMCHNVLARYTCPKCELKTCSLGCTRRHKEVKGCTGEREPNEYVKKEEIGEKVVQKDYSFIEAMISGADKVKKVLAGVNATIQMQPRRFKILRNNARQLYNIRLSNGPNILQRHRENISFFFVKTKAIYWVFELMYFQGLKSREGKDGEKNKKESKRQLSYSRVLTQPISDQKTFLQILPCDYLNRTLLQTRNINTTRKQQFLTFIQNKQRSFTSNTQSQLTQSLNDSNNGIVFTLRQSVKGSNFTKTVQLIEYKIDGKVSEQMRDVAVFQYPTLYVVHQSMRGEFLDGFRQSREVGERHLRDRESRSGDRERSREKTSRRKREQEKSEDEI